MLMRTCVVASLFAVAIIGAPACSPAAAPADTDEIATVLESFYGAMKTGDTTAAMRVIAPDALFLEGGRLETREEYEKNHLPADIEFEKQVTGKRSPLRITTQGDTAWVIATTEYEGSFNDSPVHFISAQLMVLTRESGQWLIRSIHWSSRRLT
jgi:ketosteroid isomerase-like protein